MRFVRARFCIQLPNSLISMRTLTLFVSVVLLSVGFVQGQTRIVMPTLTKLSYASTSFVNADDLVRLNLSFSTFGKYLNAKKESLDWNTNIGSDLNSNSHALLNDALPPWMKAQMWNSLSRSARNAGYAAGANVLDPPPAEQNFEIHMDAQEIYGSDDY